jgi:hypothetical protein
MLRSIGLAAVLALGLAGAALTGSTAEAAVVHPGAALGHAAHESAGGLVTPVWHHGYRHGGYYRPTRCRTVVTWRWRNGYRYKVAKRVCR